MSGRASRSNLWDGWLALAGRTALALGVWLALPAAPVAHRLDEYLQATRIAIDRERVDLEIDLTPGVAVARQVFSWIDSDRNGEISAGEGDAYAALVLDSILLNVDDRRQAVTLVERRFPTFREMTIGEGTIRLTATAQVPPAAPGSHELFFRNTHRAEMSVYLVNALVPTSKDLRIASQQRDVQQRELRLDYRVAPPAGPWRRIASLTMATLLTVLVLHRRQRLLQAKRRNAERAREQRYAEKTELDAAL